MGIDFYEKIANTLQGKTKEPYDLSMIPTERLDWSGSSVVLDLYDRTRGQEREDFIRAIGRIIEEGKQPLFVIAQALHIAASLDFAQVDYCVERLSKRDVASVEPVRGAIQNYLAFRQLRTLSL